MEILTDEAKLRQPCEPCGSIEEGLEIADQLSAALTASPIHGIGLAANQIGIQKRVCLLRVPERDPLGFRYSVELVFINPRITELSAPIKFKQEGCLSFPDQWVCTLRYGCCTVVDDTEPNGRLLVGVRAIVAQHEIDHLDSRTMYDSLFEKIKRDHLCRCGSGKNFGICCLPNVKDWK